MEILASKCVTFIILLFCIHRGGAEITIDTPFPIIGPNFTEMATAAGLPCEEVKITTEDGYILDMFHIPGDSKRPVMLQSGNLGSSDDYILRGKTSLPYVLWEAGYDVWVTNVRGCRYGRNHVSFNPDKEDEFWKFSIHEFAIYDTTAMIDYILEKTHAKTLSSIGWSCGTSVHYILGAERPEYNDKINVFISLAPICYLHHSIPFDILNNFEQILNKSAILSDEYELCGEKSVGIALLRTLCSSVEIGYNICFKIGLSPVYGFDFEQIEPEFAPIIIQHYPSSSSVQAELHLSQILSTKTFAPYDYGEADNLIRYGSPKPKPYNLSLNTMKHILISGKNDQCSTLADADLLMTKLPNIVEHIIMEPEKFNHIDFVYGKDTHKVLYKPKILDILKKYND